MNIIHLLSSANFTDNQYSEVYIPGGVTVTINSQSITVPAGSGIILPIGVSSTGSTSGTMYLIGKKKPEFYRSADGTYPIK
jgi:hypothetical protein